MRNSILHGVPVDTKTYYENCQYCIFHENNAKQNYEVTLQIKYIFSPLLYN